MGEGPREKRGLLIAIPRDYESYCPPSAVQRQEVDGRGDPHDVLGHDAKSTIQLSKLFPDLLAKLGGGTRLSFLDFNHGHLPAYR